MKRTTDISKGRFSMAGWVLPTIAYVILLGTTGITTKYALKTITWQQMVYWVPIAYVLLSAILIGLYRKPFAFDTGGAWAALTAFAAAGALILFFIALTHRSAGVVVPMTSGYPVLTLVLAAVFLHEGITVPKVIGTLLVVAGVVVLSRS